jgi:hypothetical protein
MRKKRTLAVMRKKRKSSYKLKATKAVKAKVVKKTKKAKKKNPELVYAKAYDVVGKTSSGRPKLKLVKKIYSGKSPTTGEITFASGRTKMEAEKLRMSGLSKRKKKAIRKKVSRMKNRLNKMKMQRALVFGKAKSFAEGFKIEGKYGSVSKKVKKNPGGTMNKLESTLGMTMTEVGSLAAGGLLYGAVNGAVARFARPVHSALVRVPVVGTALPTLVLGAIANYLGERQNIEALKIVGKGLVGASVVGIGVNAAQMVPFLRPAPAVPGSRPVSGLGYEEMYGLPEGMEGGQLGTDEADFGGIDYTMDGIDYTMEGVGADEADFGGIDYTMEGVGADEADFGALPEGMGDGQLG